MHDQVRIREEQGRIILEPLPQEKLSLERLLAGITADMLHEETDFGGPQGSEVW